MRPAPPSEPVSVNALIDKRRTTRHFLGRMGQDKESEKVSIFGATLREDRRGKNMTQEDLGTLLGVGRSTIAMIEKGVQLSFDDEANYEKLARYLGRTAEEWKRLAMQSQRTFHLSGKGVTDEHRRTGELLSAKWEDLSASALRAIRQVISGGAPEGAGAKPKKGGGAK